MELFAEAIDYDPVVVIGEMAHVAASSDKGPRADPSLSSRDRDDYENLLLLCKNCHARVDGQPSAFPSARLREIKDAHEAWVRASLPERGRSRTGWTVVVLEGDHALDLSTVDAALVPDFVDGDPRHLTVPGVPSDWISVDETIAAQATALIASGDTVDRRVAVFPLAPVSACVALGFHLTSRPHVRLFQYHRDDHTWTWPKAATPAQDLTVAGLCDPDPNCRTVGFFFHISAPILDAALGAAGEYLDRRIDFRASSPSTAWLQHADQLRYVAFEARRAFERAVQLYPHAVRWHLFYAGPAPLAVAIGQQINPTMYPPVQLYEYRHNATPQYQPSIQLAK